MVSGVQYDEPVVEQCGTTTNIYIVASTGGVGSVVDVFGKSVTGLVGGICPSFGNMLVGGSRN